MADTIVISPAADPNAVAQLPEKSALKSNSMWASIILVVLSQLTSFGVPEWIATALNANKDSVVGLVMLILGLYNGWATMRRKTTLKL